MFRGPYGLAIHDGRTGDRLPPGRLPDLGVQGLMNPGPEFGVAPAPEVPVDSLPLGKVVGQGTPYPARPAVHTGWHVTGRPIQVERRALGAAVRAA